MPLNVNSIYCTEHTIKSCFFLSRCYDLCLLIGVFSAFILNVIIDIVKFKSVILLFFSICLMYFVIVPVFLFYCLFFFGIKTIFFLVNDFNHSVEILALIFLS